MSWLEKLLPAKITPSDPSERRQMPEGLWTKCPSCETVLYKTDLEHNQNVCPSCGHHHRIGARLHRRGVRHSVMGSPWGFAYQWRGDCNRRHRDCASVCLGGHRHHHRLGHHRMDIFTFQLRDVRPNHALPRTRPPRSPSAVHDVINGPGIFHAKFSRRGANLRKAIPSV